MPDVPNPSEPEVGSWQTDDGPWAGYGLECDGGPCCGDATGCGDVVDCGGACCRRPGFLAGMELPLLQAHYGAGRIRVPGEFRLSQCTPDFDHEATPRFWLGYESCDGLAMRVRYWQFDHTGSAVDAQRQYYVQVGLAAEDLDFEIAQSAQLGRWEFELAGGARWAKVTDDIRVNWDGDRSTWARRFEGGGPTLALGARRPLGVRGLGLVANFRASFIYGDTRATLSDELEIDEDIWAVIDDHVLEIYEIQVGAEWSKTMSAGFRLTGRVVLEGQVWDLAQGPGALGLADANLGSGVFDTNLGFVGPSFSLAIER
jgi:hypothetical protein